MEVNGVPLLDYRLSRDSSKRGQKDDPLAMCVVGIRDEYREIEIEWLKFTDAWKAKCNGGRMPTSVELLLLAESFLKHHVMRMDLKLCPNNYRRADTLQRAGYSYQKIGEFLNCNKKTAQVWVRKARGRKLWKSMNPERLNRIARQRYAELQELNGCAASLKSKGKGN